MASRNVLFGDTFGTKADYSSGVFYAGRMRYLTDGAATHDNGVLVPPKELMTRKQAQKVIRLEQQVPKVRAMRMRSRCDARCAIKCVSCVRAARH